MARASTTRAKRTLAPDEPPEPEEPVADDLDAPPAAADNSDDEDLFPDTDEDADEGEEELPDYDEESDEDDADAGDDSSVYAAAGDAPKLRFGVTLEPEPKIVGAAW